MEKQKTFRIGIAMAGAVSAGAYTGGVMDYLLETLDQWEQAKARNREIEAKYGKNHKDYDPSIPMHDVVIDVIGGASAGGMTSAITALAAFEGVCPVNDSNPDKADNMLYDCWVNLNDREGKPTLKQMLDAADIYEAQGVPSILNSTPIDKIADRAANLNQINPLPPYISKKLEIILTICSLRGIPISVNFSEKVKDNSVTAIASVPAHRMNIHKGVAHFRLDDGEPIAPHAIPFNPNNEKDRKLLMKCAKATGAFPIGLKPRLIKETHLEYIKAMVTRMLSYKDEQGVQRSPDIEIGVKDEIFEFVAVDGGTVNNEPFGEVIRALQEKCSQDGSDYAVMLIDPFPNFEDKSAAQQVKHPSKIMELIPNILGAIRGQAMVKETDIVRGLTNDHKIRMIFPKRGDDPYPISCGSLDGFGGFFSRDFREHDFFLGRKNAQGFLRKYFTIKLEAAKNHPIFEDWQQDDSDPRHKRFFIKSEEGSGYYPIIPDMSLREYSLGSKHPSNHALPIPERKGLAAGEVFDLQAALTNRLSEVLLNLFKFESGSPKQDEAEEAVKQLIAQQEGKKSKKEQKGKSLRMIILNLLWQYLGAYWLASYLSKKAIRAVLVDFKRRGLLE